jgi:Tfp pilus assembly protein PilF
MTCRHRQSDASSVIGYLTAVALLPALECWITDPARAWVGPKIFGPLNGLGSGKVVIMRSLIRFGVVWMASALAGYAVCVGDSPQTGTAMKSMTVAELVKAGDECRAQKEYSQALSYFREALRTDKHNAKIYNKAGLAELQTRQLDEARADFAKAAKYDRHYPEAFNNIGAVYYVEKNYGIAANYFKKAVALDETRALFHVNLGAAWFEQDQTDRAMREYTRALELDPGVLARESRTGITAMVGTTEERAKHEYMIAKIYARMGNVDDCLVCLRKAKENGYRDLIDVYKDQEFAAVRQDARLAEIVPPPAPK